MAFFSVSLIPILHSIFFFILCEFSSVFPAVVAIAIHSSCKLDGVIRSRCKNQWMDRFCQVFHQWWNPSSINVTDSVRIGLHAINISSDSCAQQWVINRWSDKLYRHVIQFSIVWSTGGHKIYPKRKSKQIKTKQLELQAMGIVEKKKE